MWFADRHPNGLRPSRRLRLSGVPGSHLFQILDPSRLNGCADQSVLLAEPFGEGALVEIRDQKVIIARTLAGQDRAAVVDERKDDRFRSALVLGLNVVRYTVVFDVCVEAGNHKKAFAEKEMRRRTARKPSKSYHTPCLTVNEFNACVRPRSLPTELP